jgi:hypothetical protein
MSAKLKTLDWELFKSEIGINKGNVRATLSLG